PGRPEADELVLLRFQPGDELAVEAAEHQRPAGAGRPEPDLLGVGIPAVVLHHHRRRAEPGLDAGLAPADHAAGALPLRGAPVAGVAGQEQCGAEHEADQGLHAKSLTHGSLRWGWIPPVVRGTRADIKELMERPSV